MGYSPELQEAIAKFYGPKQREAVDKCYGGDWARYDANVARARAATAHEQTVAELEEAQARADSGEHTNTNGF